MSENDGEKSQMEVACEGQTGNDANEDVDAAIKTLENRITLCNREHVESTEELEKKIQRMVELKKEMGNNFCKMGRFDQAISNFKEAIMYNPWDVEAYCSRALCYTSVGKLVEGLKDAVKCLELDPTFVKGHLRKGNIEFEMKDYSKALDTYEMGKQHDDQNKEIHDAISRCRKKISSAPDKRTVMQSHEGLNETQKALPDPEVQAILHDPIMRQVLTDFQQNSRHAHDHAKNKLVVQKLKKLLDAGLL